jgi:hypothetical protein
MIIYTYISAPRRVVLNSSSGEQNFSVRTETDSTVMVSPSSTGALATPPLYHRVCLYIYIHVDVVCTSHEYEDS